MSPLEAQAEQFGSSYRWLATATVMLGTIATTATATIVNVAMGDIMGAFGLGQDQVQWLSTGFLAAMTATMLMTAWALDRLGFRNTFIGALTIFVAGCILGATSRSGAEVILARVLQGGASGIIQPLAMVVMSQVFPPEQRGKAMGIYGVGIVLAPALGPTAGGILVDQYDWRDVFLVVVPFCVAGMGMASVTLPGLGRAENRQHQKFDAVGFALLVIALVAVLTGLSNGQREGWDSDFVLSMFATATVSTIAFIGFELHTPHPLLSLHVFAVGRFSAGCAVAFALGAGIYGSTYVVPLFVQSVQGYTPTRSGLLLMPAGFILALVFPIAGQLSDRLPPHIPIMTGLALFGLSCWFSGGVDVDTSFWTLALLVMLGRVGLGVMLPALNAGALRALPRDRLAQGSGSLNFVRQLGGAFGVNLLSVLIDRRTAFHGDALAQALTPANSAGIEALTRLSILFSHWGNPFGNRLPTGIHPGSMGFLETVLVSKARLIAYQDSFYVVALVFFLAIIPAFAMGRGSKTSARAG
ncbi:DHA2 family efflux MFS transporter permease subunit [Bradyrhizobium viridifuturi]|uniref:DHA2 family efflux MFS transporter permease subunit n=1 Tax=uncultured Bradyrhizobium sp. TaxID=199684 RepID=UPI001BA7D7F2|nr:DHA2 family efflux MFS transporter permease subunit [uncultured Bradyrhizobium sp.]MBR1040602.1 DHA2 family efflux MFS transporter permease subunit [Bradyrhizobium viridifuturi]MBR1074890.1 DHA2 family efflux MFS transporter permease subunit [Bradyrhizobium viridifuturi]